MGLKLFIGTKILLAEPLSLGAYNTRRGWPLPADEDPGRSGYFLEYPDGYQSWSPKEVFEGAYREISFDELIVVRGASPIKTPSTFITRLADEYNEVSGRFDKLHQFVEHNPEYTALDENQQSLLRSQRSAMSTYLEVLEKRVTALGIPENGETS